eukprot:791086-Amphidinium_carterae.1
MVGGGTGRSQNGSTPQAADKVLGIVDKLSAYNPTPEPPLQHAPDSHELSRTLCQGLRTPEPSTAPKSLENQKWVKMRDPSPSTCFVQQGNKSQSRHATQGSCFEYIAQGSLFIKTESVGR